MRARKRILLCGMMLLLFSVAVKADTNPYGIFLDKKQVQVGNSFYTMANGIFEQNDRLYVSLREMAELLRIPVDWDAEKEIGVLRPEQKRTAVISRDENMIKENTFCVIPDEDTAYQIGKAVLESALQEKVVFTSEEWKSILKVSYEGHDGCNYWEVTQEVYYNGALYRGVNASNCVRIHKNTGEVLKIILCRPEYQQIKEEMDKAV